MVEPFHDFHTHADVGEANQSLVDGVGVKTEFQHGHDNMGGILDRCGVQERNAVGELVDSEKSMIVFGGVGNRIGGLRTTPGYFLQVVVFGKGEEGVEFGVVVVEDQFGGMLKEFEFLDGLLRLVLEKLGVGHADIGQDADGGSDDVGEGLHLVGFGDAGFEDGQVMVFRHAPDREGHADLGVVAVGTSHDEEVVVEHSVEPFFDNGFAIRAGDADDGVVELGAVVLGEGLQGGESVVHNEEIALRVEVGGGGVGDHKVVHAVAGQFGDVSVAVVLAGLEGEEEGLVGFADFPAVEAQAGDVDSVIADDALQRVDYMGNIGNGHFQ